MKLRPHFYVPEELGVVHAQEAAGRHKEGGETRQVPTIAAVHIISVQIAELKTSNSQPPSLHLKELRATMANLVTSNGLLQRIWL